jgi:hypothetical protein
MVLADAPASRYGEAALSAGLGDLDWVSRCALGHDGLIRHLARSHTVVPAKLFTVFRSEESARAHALAGRRSLDRVFRHVEGCREWGVRVLLEEARDRRGSGARPVPRARAGAAFLRRKSRLLHARADQRKARAAAETTHRALVRMARDARRLATAAAPAARRLLLDAAYLVPRGEDRRFRVEVGRWARRHAPLGHRVTVTGPWPPYNFVGSRS